MRDEQPAPVANGHPAVWDLVIADMHARDALGRERYGTPLQAGNGRDALRDAYEEALDLAVYLRQALEERSLAAERLVPRFEASGHPANPYQAPAGKLEDRPGYPFAAPSRPTPVTILVLEDDGA